MRDQPLVFTSKEVPFIRTDIAWRVNWGNYHDLHKGDIVILLGFSRYAVQGPHFWNRSTSRVWYYAKLITDRGTFVWRGLNVIEAINNFSPEQELVHLRQTWTNFQGIFTPLDKHSP